METSTLTQKGQATIPKRILDHLGLRPQERIAFRIVGDSVLMERSAPTDELAGALKHYARKPIPQKQELREAMAKAAIERDQKTQ